MTKTANKTDEGKKAFAKDPHLKRIQKYAGKPKQGPSKSSGGKKK